MKTKNFLVCIVSLSMFLIFYSCKKSEQIDKKNDEQTVSEWTSKFLENQQIAKSYVELVKLNFQNGIRYNKNIQNRTLNEADSNYYYENNARQALVHVDIMAVDSGWYSLSDYLRQQVLQNVADSVSNPYFIANNPNSPIVISINDFMSNIQGITQDALTGRLSFSCDFTWQEITGCVIGTIASSVELIQASKKIWEVVKGTSSWGWSQMWGLAKMAVKEFVPWWRILQAVGTLASCLIGAC